MKKKQEIEMSEKKQVAVAKKGGGIKEVAGGRINIALNMERWKALDPEVTDQLLWFHQYVLDNRFSMKEAAEALGVHNSTVYRALYGTYEGSWDNIRKSIESFRRTAELRGSIQQNSIVENSIVRLISSALDYAMANNSITLIIGESRMGKTVSAKRWRDANNHGRSVFVTAPPIGGSKTFLRRIAEAVGVNKNLSMAQMFEAIERAFNSNRMLIVDEAHRLMPSDSRSNPVNIEILRDIHDATGCALALISTERFSSAMQKSQYQYEQVLGRIGMPVRLRREIGAKDIRPIVSQYIETPSTTLIAKCKSIANDSGRLGILAETLKVASRIANKQSEELVEEHVFKAIALRNQMMGEHTYARK